MYNNDYSVARSMYTCAVRVRVRGQNERITRTSQKLILALPSPPREKKEWEYTKIQNSYTQKSTATVNRLISPYRSALLILHITICVVGVRTKYIMWFSGGPPRCPPNRKKNHNNNNDTAKKSATSRDEGNV